MAAKKKAAQSQASNKDSKKGAEYPQGSVETEFKGNPILCLNPDDAFQFQFGVGKAEIILSHIEDIKDFVKKYAKKR